MTLRDRNIPVFVGIVVLAATVALKLGVGGSHAATSSHTAVSSTLHAFVHESAEIGMTFDDGTEVGSQAKTPPTIPPGTYVIRVTDDAVTHNFHLMGPGVDMATPVDEMATPTWTVTFQPGSTYKFQCDVHSDYMFAAFQTSGASSSSGGSSSGGTSSGGTSSGGTSSGGTSSGGTSSGGTSSSGGKTIITSGHTALLGTLAGTLGASGKATLTRSGKAVSKLKAGTYKFTITDQSAKAGFTIHGAQTNALTGVAFVGKHSAIVKLTAGKWTFYSSAGGSKRTFVVS